MRDLIYQRIEELTGSRTQLYFLLLLFYIGAYVALGVSSDADISSVEKLDKTILLVAQAFASGFFFLLIPWLFMVFGLQAREPLVLGSSPKTVGLIFLIIVSNMFVMSPIIEWNIGLDLPDGAFEDWAQSKEEGLKVLTEYLVAFDGFYEFSLALIVMAVLPALGEEVLFRGLLQNFIRKTTSNAHLGIWISATLFSAIHLQFYGFFPRMILGALFGYLYVWSGRLSTAIWAHFFHNGLALTFAYLAGMSASDLEDMERSAPIYLIIGFLGIGVWAAFQFIKNTRNA